MEKIHLPPPFFSRRRHALPLSPGENCPKIFSCRRLFLSRRRHMLPISPKSKSPPLTPPARLTPTQHGAAPSLRPTRAGVAPQQAPPPTPHAYSSSRHRPSEGATPLAPPPVAVTPSPHSTRHFERWEHHGSWSEGWSKQTATNR